MVIKKRLHRAFLILAGCCVVFTLCGGMFLACYGNFVVPICEELGCGRAEISVFQTAFFIAQIPAFPLTARLYEKYNIRIVMSVSVIGFALNSAAMSLYTIPWQWAVAGAFAGVFSCCFYITPTASMVTNWFKKRVGLAMGFMTAIASLFAVFFSPVLASMISTFGWRMSFVIEAVIMVVVGLPWCLFVFVDSPCDIGEVPYGATYEEYYGEGEAEEDAQNASSDGKLKFRKSLLGLPFIMLFLFTGIATLVGKGFDPHLPGFAQSLGYDAAFGALLVSALSFGSFCEKIIMGWVNDKFGVWRGAAIELVIVSIGIIGLIFCKNQWLLLVSCFFFGVQDSLTNIASPLLLRTVFGEKRYASLYSWTRVGGGIFGAPATMLVGYCFDVTSSFILAFVAAQAAIVVAAAAVVIAYAWYKKQSDKPVIEA